MLLSQLRADPARFQLRHDAYDKDVCAGIVKEGIIPGKFGKLPIIPVGDESNTYIIAGDGHSRFAAVQALAAKSHLPDAWVIDADKGEFDIPCEIVEPGHIKSLMLANLGRKNLSASEEADGYQKLMDQGMTIEDIALRSHRDESTIRRVLLINTLADCIREQIGRPADAGGISRECAIEFAKQCQQHGINKQQQGQLWHGIFTHYEFTPNTIRSFFKKMGQRLAEKSSGDDGGGMLFAIPTNVTAAVKDMQKRSKEVSRVLTSLRTLLRYASQDYLDAAPGLKAALQQFGPQAMNQLQYESESDGIVLANLVANK